MVVVMQFGATDEQIERVAEMVRDAGGEAFVSRGTVHTIIGLVGDTARFQALPLKQLPGVDHVIQVGKPYKMVARDLHPEPTTVKVGTTPVGRAAFTIIAGPCAVESDEQALAAAGGARRRGRRSFAEAPTSHAAPRTRSRASASEDSRSSRSAGSGRGFRSRPRSSTQGRRARRRVGGLLQIGTRNMQNFGLLREVGQTKKPVMLKRGLSATVEEWLMAAEYVAQRGNSEIILCERGIRTFETATRNTLDLGGMVVAQEESHLPVIVDPSHAMGVRELVAPMALAALAAGADAVMVDVHADPENALCDGPQALTPAQVLELGGELRSIAAALGRPVNE